VATTTDAPTGTRGGLDRYFRISERGSTVRREVRGGLVTFMTMAYIVVLNPLIIGLAKDADGRVLGIPQVAGVTALVAAVTTIAMGVFGRLPIALATGLGLNAFLAVAVASRMSWPDAMGLIVLEGLIITLLVLTGFRIAVFRAVPAQLKTAIAVGIGLFLALIGLVDAGIVRRTGAGPVPVQLGATGSLRGWPVLVFVLGLAIMAILVARGVRGAVLIVFTLMLADFFDTMGTVVAVSAEAGLLDDEGNPPDVQRVLLVDSLAAAAGGAASASSATSYVESTAGVADGARTGLASVVTGLLFVLALFLTPLVSLVPSEAATPALIIVGCLLMMQVRDLDLTDFGLVLPAFLTIVMMPFTYSITNGIGAGFVSYVVLQAARGRARTIHPLLWVVAALFVVYFALAPIEDLLGIS
jgi:AGZA family xanthine/uracil permease-like MFS transporter